MCSTYTSVIQRKQERPTMTNFSSYSPLPANVRSYMRQSIEHGSEPPPPYQSWFIQKECKEQLVMSAMDVGKA